MNTKKRRDIEKRLHEAAIICAKHGAQFTELRRSVLNLILEADGPLTAYQLLDRLKETRKSAVPPTIYRALDFLIEQGLIHKIERLNAFISCTERDHDHHAVQFLICGRCGTVAEIEDHAISKALERAAERQGFHPKNAVVELDGTCADCSAHAS
jgi:Fur family transcriptional regulator, zinc uptake regulator